MAEFRSVAEKTFNVPEDTTPVPVNYNGNKFVVYAAGDKEVEANKNVASAAASIAKSSGINVNWPADGQWHDTDQDTRNAVNITRYCIQNDGWIMKYRINFDTPTPGIYAFTDGTNDTYTKSVAVTTISHSIDYNSDDATIKYVSFVGFDN